MDWTTPLKFQQADFIKRLNQSSAHLLHSQTTGLHSEIVEISGQRLKEIRATCRQMVPKSEQSAPVSEILKEHLKHQLGVEAIATCLDNLVTKLDPEKIRRTKGTVDFTLKASPAIGVHVKVACGSIDTVEWAIAAEEFKSTAAVVFILLSEQIDESEEKYHAILAGFLPTEYIQIHDGRATLKPQDLLYLGGLSSYLDSLKSQPLPLDWLRILTGASSYVYPVAISSDGRTVASGSYDGTIKLWHLSDRKLTQALCGHSWSFYPVAAGSGGQPLASGSTERKLNVCEMDSGKFIRTLPGHTSGVSAVAISEDGKRMVSGGYDGTINVWNLEQGQLLRTISGHSGTVRPIAISPNGKILVSGGIDKVLNLWNLETGELIRSFELNTDAVISLAISPNGQLLVSGSQDGVVKIWNLDNGQLIRILSAHSGIVRAVAISDDGQTLASGSLEKTIKLWNIYTGDLIRTLTGHSDPTIAFAVKPEGPTLELSLFRHNQSGWEDPRQWQ